MEKTKKSKKEETKNTNVDVELTENELDTLQQWRAFRNKRFHANTDEYDREELNNQTRHMKFKLTDLLAFWCSHPLINRFEFLDARGNARVWTLGLESDFKEIKLAADTPKCEQGHVYVLWHKHEDDSYSLLDLWPWVHEESDKNFHQKVLYSFSHTIVRLNDVDICFIVLFCDVALYCSLCWSYFWRFFMI